MTQTKDEILSVVSRMSEVISRNNCNIAETFEGHAIETMDNSNVDNDFG